MLTPAPERPLPEWVALGPGGRFSCRHCLALGAAPAVKFTPARDFPHVEGCLVPLAEAAEDAVNADART